MTMVSSFVSQHQNPPQDGSFIGIPFFILFKASKNFINPLFLLFQGQLLISENSNLASIGTGTQLATLSMNNKSITGISFNGYKTVEIMVIIQQASNGNMFFNFTLVPLVSHILDGARYITIPGKSYGYCANVLLSINYSAGTVTLIEADVNEGFGLNSIYILGLK